VTALESLAMTEIRHPARRRHMREFPHHYLVAATARPDGDVAIDGETLPTLRTAPPEAFGGPGDRWSPETLLSAALADCFILTFRAIAKSSGLPWTSLRCEANGTLDRVDRVTQFTAFDVRAELCVPEGTDEGRARRVLEKAEQNCLVSNSLKASVHLDAVVTCSSDTRDAEAVLV
jgi:organic hydroperoxide reductase OsmC/OhrA